MCMNVHSTEAIFPEGGHPNTEMIRQWFVGYLPSQKLRYRVSEHLVDCEGCRTRARAVREGLEEFFDNPPKLS